MTVRDDQIQKIRAILAEQIGVDAGDLQPEAHIQDDLGADSLDVVEMVMALEEMFDIEIPDTEAEKMRTLGDVESFVLEQLPG